MTHRWHSAILPLYLAACLMLGGSTTGIWTNLALQLGAIGLLAIALDRRNPDRAPRHARRLVALLVATFLLVLLQLIPLPPAVWTRLPGRGFVAHGLTMFGQPLPWMPLSLTPAETLTSACFLLPPAAILVWIMRRGALPLRATVAILLAVGFVGALLGLGQVSSGDTRWYLYPFSSWGKAPGFFANSAHMAMLMLASAPFLAALAIDTMDRLDRSRAVAIGLGGFALFAVMMGLVAINSSAAVLMLTAPVLFLTAALWGGRGAVWLRRFAVPLILAAVVGATLLTYLSGRSAASNATSVATRSTIWAHSGEALGQFGLAGSGIGSFADVYRRFEPPATIELTYVNHAHNDYLELALETGLAGAALITLFLIWWARAAWAAWRGPNENVYARAATIASGAILVHELVEYPLRSPALAVLFALCIGLMAMVGVLPARQRAGELWPSRHLTID